MPIPLEEKLRLILKSRLRTSFQCIIDAFYALLVKDKHAT